MGCPLPESWNIGVRNYQKMSEVWDFASVTFFFLFFASCPSLPHSLKFFTHCIHCRSSSCDSWDGILSQRLSVFKMPWIDVISITDEFKRWMYNNGPWMGSCQGTTKCSLWTLDLINIQAGRTELQNYISITDGDVTQVLCSGDLQLGLLIFAQYVATSYFLKLLIGAKFSLKHHSAGARVAAGEGPPGAEEEQCPDRNNFSGRNSCMRPGKSILPSCMSCAQHNISISRLACAVFECKCGLL